MREVDGDRDLGPLGKCRKILIGVCCTLLFFRTYFADRFAHQPSRDTVFLKPGIISLVH